MKKIILTALVALFSFAHHANAQSSMIATLNHEGTVSTFYGPTALRAANAAATHGDVITLSSGTFLSTKITKAITLRGAGMEVDSVTQTVPTILAGNFSIDIPDSVTHRLTVEGIYHDAEIEYHNVCDPMFMKCRLKVFDYYSYSTSKLKNASFINCKVVDELSIAPNSSIACINCAIEDPYAYSQTTSIMEFQNCVIAFGDLYPYSCYTSTFYNCVICTEVNSSNGRLPASAAAFNCVGTGSGRGYLFSYMNSTTNKVVAEPSSIFKTYDGKDMTEKKDEEKYVLTDAAKTKYLGTDGKQVGIYGGSLPFDPTPTNPQITKCNVASKSTADGKLSVDIEVKAAE